MIKKNLKLETIEKLLGKVDNNLLDKVESHVCENMAMFMPNEGANLKSMNDYHTHTSYQFAMPFDDKISFFIDEKELVTKPGYITGFSPNVLHREAYRDVMPHYVVIVVDKDFFETHISTYKLDNLPKFSGNCTQVPIDLIMYIKSFMVESDNASLGSEEFMQGLSVAIIHSIIRGFIGVKVDKSRIAKRFEINCILEYMHVHYGEKLTLDSLASFAKMSKTHFTRVFKEETGKSVMDYLADLRMDNVKRMLSISDMTIAEIANECGFKSVSYLSSSFQKKYGISPSEYRGRMNSN